MSVNVTFHGPLVPVSAAMLRDAGAFRDAMREAQFDIEIGPRYGPPAPSPAEERCEHCGHVLDDDGDDW